MPSFDVVSEIDQQEIRNAVDQAAREVTTRYDFKGTDTTIELSDTEIKLNSASEDRLAALRQLLEEKVGSEAFAFVGLVTHVGDGGCESRASA